MRRRKRSIHSMPVGRSWSKGRRNPRAQVKRNTSLACLLILGTNGLQRCVYKIGIIEFGHIPGLLSCDWKQSSRKWLVPFYGEAGHVADDQLELLLGDVAGQRDGVEAGT